MTDFVDRVVVHFKGGNGGNGASSIRREKYKPLAGPDGGNGGRGGSIILQASSDETSLLDFRYLPHRSAANGKHGEGDYRDGKQGEDIIVKVPVGTVVFQAVGKVGEPKHRGIQLADLKHENSTFIVAHGGFGGLGNHALANKAHRAPGFALKGEPGEEVDVILELKSVADVALVGYPSAGKSSLISAISAARPKIADYPFTTLHPNLGVAWVDGYEMVIADIPGLIEGAHEGVGLGDRFLKHVERCSAFLHLVDASSEDVVKIYKDIRKELDLYNEILKNKPEIIVLNKCDALTDEEIGKKQKALEKAIGKKVYVMSAVAKKGIFDCLIAVNAYITRDRKKKEENLSEEKNVAEEAPKMWSPLD